MNANKTNYMAIPKNPLGHTMINLEDKPLENVSKRKVPECCTDEQMDHSREIKAMM